MNDFARVTRNSNAVGRIDIDDLANEITEKFVDHGVTARRQRLQVRLAKRRRERLKSVTCGEPWRQASDKP